MRKIYIIVLLILLGNACKKPIIKDTGICNIPFADSSALHPKNVRLQKLLQDYKKKGLPGVSVYVTDNNGAWVGSAGKADIENDIDYKPCHVQKVASLTKMFMGALVFQLIEDSVHTGLGYNSLDKPINTWIPEKYLKKIANAEQITLRQCMNHSSGLYDVIKDNGFYLEVLNDPTKQWGPLDLLEYVRNKDAVFVPGTQHDYSNTNTLMVSLVIDFATGRPHYTWLREKILNPLQLNNTYYHHHERLPSTTAQGYYDLYQKQQPVNVSNYVTGSGNGYTGIYSNVFDLQIFLKALLVNKTLISPKSLAIMQTVGATDDADLSLGLGVMRRFEKRGINYAWGHTGRDLGYAADLFYFPNKNATIAWCINYGADANSYLKPVILDFQRELIDLMLE